MATMPTNAQDLFDNLVPQGLAQYPDKARELNAAYCFKVTGDGGGEWTVDCTANPPTCTKGDSGKAQCTVEVSSEDFRRRAGEVGERIRADLEAIAGRVDSVGEVRGLGSMLAIELVEDRGTKAPAGELASATTAAARERGLILLSCGLYGNVIRILVPLVVSDEDLDRGLELLEEALVEAGTRAI